MAMLEPSLNASSSSSTRRPAMLTVSLQRGVHRLWRMYTTYFQRRDEGTEHTASTAIPESRVGLASVIASGASVSVCIALARGKIGPRLVVSNPIFR